MIVRARERSVWGPGRAAFSIVEVVLAFLILGLSLLPVVNLFTSSSRQAAQTSDFGLAITLTEKVAEELRLANWENAHLLDQIEADPSMGIETPVVDGQSPFFAAIEDRSPPFGQIQVGVDPGITSDFGTLRKELSSFRIGFSTRPTALATGSVLDLTLKTVWSDFQGKRRELPLEVRLARHHAFTPLPPAIASRKEADERIVSLLYPGKAGQSLTSLVAASNGDLATIRNVGDVALLSKALSDSEAEFSGQVLAAQRSVANESSPIPKARAQIGLARLFERRAALCLFTLCYAVRPLQELADSFEGAKLGDPRPDRNRWYPHFLRIGGVAWSFDRALTSARDSYMVACARPISDGLRPRVWVRSLFKALACEKLKVVTSGPASTSTLVRILADFEKWTDGRNVNFGSYVRSEKGICRSVDSLKSSIPENRYRSWQEFRRAASAATVRVIQRGGGGVPTSAH